MASASGEKSSSNTEKEFFSSDFSITLEVKQAVIDFDWFDVAFLESRAYTTVDPGTGRPLDELNEIITLSDGKVPASGPLAAIPQMAYFINSITIRSEALAQMSQEEHDKFIGKAGGSWLGFGPRGKRTSDTIKLHDSDASTRGELVLDGQFLIAFAYRWLGLAPNPNFADHPDPAHWI